MRRWILATVFFCGFLSFANISFAYDWPVEPFTSQHGISGTLGEYRGVRYFHAGVDINEPNGRPVYAPDTCIVDSLSWTGGEHWLGVFKFVHFTNDTVFSDGDTIPPGTHIGHIVGDHLHFRESSSRLSPHDALNPFRDNALTPYGDSTDPQIDSILFYRQGFSDSLMSDSLEGRVILHRKVDILSEAGDTRTDATGHDDGPKVSVYRIGYQIKKTLLDTHGQPRGDTLLWSRENIEFDSIANPSSPTQVELTYGPDSRYTPPPPRFRYWVTNDPFNPVANLRDWYWNTKHKDDGQLPPCPEHVDAESVDVAKFKRGYYWVKVFAYDIHTNADSESIQVYIDNFGPRVDSIYPPDSAIGIPPDTFIYVRFDEPMDTTESLDSIATLDPEVPISWQWTDTTRTKIRGTPDSLLEPCTEYTLTIRAHAGADSLRDLVRHLFDGNRDGNPGGDFQLTFHTGTPEMEIEAHPWISHLKQGESKLHVITVRNLSEDTISAELYTEALGFGWELDPPQLSSPFVIEPDSVFTESLRVKNGKELGTVLGILAKPPLQSGPNACPHSVNLL